jgi:hypothetical protein
MRLYLGMCAAALLAVTGALHAQRSNVADRVAAWARVDSTHFVVGDLIRVRADVTHPKGATLRTVVPDSLEAFHVLDRLPVTPIADTLSSTGIVVARYNAGGAPIPPFTIFYTLPGDTTTKSVLTNPVPVTVSTVAVDTTQDIKDLQPPLSIPISLAEIVLYAGVVIALAGLGYLGYRLWMKRKQTKPGEAYTSPPRAAHVIALEGLAIVRKKKLWQQGLIKQYYTEVTDVLRLYYENRYRLQALEETTDEIMAGLRRLRFPDDLLQETERILRRADLVKFAKLQPGIPEHEEMMTVVEHVVLATKIVPITEAPAHVGK